VSIIVSFKKERKKKKRKILVHTTKNEFHANLFSSSEVSIC